MLNQSDCADRWECLKSQPGAPGGCKSMIYHYKYICFLTNDKGTRDTLQKHWLGIISALKFIWCFVTTCV